MGSRPDSGDFDPVFALSGRALVLVLAALVGPSHDAPAQAEVVAATLDVRDAPDDSAFRSARLRRGMIVTVRRTRPDGWLAIAPPADCFEWIDERAITLRADESGAEVISARATVRSAQSGARIPGPVLGQRNRGDQVRLVDRPVLRVTADGQARTLRAILPAPGEVRYVRASGVRTNPVESTPVAEIRTSLLAQATTGDIRGDLAHTEAMHRAVVRGPIEEWWLEPVKARYQALLPRAGDSATASVIRERLAVLARQEQLARDALTFQNVLRRSRLRDGPLASLRRQVASAKGDERPSFDAEGFIQPSARKIEGEKALALIGPDGFAVAYLRVPPGLDTRQFETRRVGVRGEVHYDERLHARVIAVNDIEALERAR